jgi:hypothetical protein
MEIPIKKLESDNDICDTVVFKSAAMPSKEGRYISIENGPMAVFIPSTSINKAFLFLVIIVVAQK